MNDLYVRLPEWNVGGEYVSGDRHLTARVFKIDYTTSPATIIRHPEYGHVVFTLADDVELTYDAIERLRDEKNRFFASVGLMELYRRR